MRSFNTARTAWIVAALLLVDVCHAGIVWEGAQDLGGGWKHLSWFGDFYSDSSPWIYHAEHGWLYVYGASTHDLWMWTPDTDWRWTSESVYPWIYRAADGSWLWFWRNQKSGRQYFNLTSGKAEDDSMAVVPAAGAYRMGDDPVSGFVGEPAYGFPDERPGHMVRVSTFFIDKTEVTKTLWSAVWTWATTHGYQFDNRGDGKAATHPVQSVSWFDAIKWCNARSEMNGRTPCYFTSAAKTAVYRTGRVGLQSDFVDWNAKGYRLPTEAEWEKAARGRVDGWRFPWGQLITHGMANYYSSGTTTPKYYYDYATTRGFHPTFAIGGWPYTSPAGTFAANGYGIYDMAGNVWEWCWDRYQWDWYANPAASADDTRGPATGESRVRRGGSWNRGPEFARVGCRAGANYPDDLLPPSYAFSSTGFRTVRAP